MSKILSNSLWYFFLLYFMTKILSIEEKLNLFVCFFNLDIPLLLPHEDKHSLFDVLLKKFLFQNYNGKDSTKEWEYTITTRGLMTDSLCSSSFFPVIHGCVWIELSHNQRKQLLESAFTERLAWIQYQERALSINETTSKKRPYLLTPEFCILYSQVLFLYFRSSFAFFLLFIWLPKVVH